MMKVRLVTIVLVKISTVKNKLDQGLEVNEERGRDVDVSWNMITMVRSADDRMCELNR